MASSRAAEKAFGNNAETVCSLEFLTDITLPEKISEGRRQQRGEARTCTSARVKKKSSDFLKCAVSLSRVLHLNVLRVLEP